MINLFYLFIIMCFVIFHESMMLLIVEIMIDFLKTVRIYNNGFF